MRGKSICKGNLPGLNYASSKRTLFHNLKFPANGEACKLQGAPRIVESCLHQDRKGMTRALMEVIASGAVAKPEEIGRYARCTLLAATHAEQDFKVGTIAFETFRATCKPI